jgi:hypothetical protein
MVISPPFLLILLPIACGFSSSSNPAAAIRLSVQEDERSQQSAQNRDLGAKKVLPGCSSVRDRLRAKILRIPSDTRVF